MNKKYLFLILLAAVAILPLAASAQTTIGTMADAIKVEVIDVGWSAVIIAWVVTAIMFLLATGDPGKLGNAKICLLAAILGTIIMIIAPNAIAFVQNSFKIS